MALRNLHSRNSAHTTRNRRRLARNLKACPGHHTPSIARLNRAGTTPDSAPSSRSLAQTIRRLSLALSCPND